MSNENKAAVAAPTLANCCTSPIVRASSSGATTTQFASSIPCFTPASSATATPSGESAAKGAPPPATDLLAHVANEYFAARIASIAGRVLAASDQPTVHALFREGVTLLGASCAVFVSFVQDQSRLSTCRLMLACDPDWVRVYVHDANFAHDPWLAYAADHSEPIVASALNVVDIEHQRVAALAAHAGFVSTVLIPAHSGGGRSRISVLCLGSSTPGYFEGEGTAQLRVSARMLALELHDWWLSRIRRDLMAKARITPSDLILLQHQCQGHSSKRIAAELQVSKSSINSRFQRMNGKLGVGTRRKAVQLAIECGLILK